MLLYFRKLGSAIRVATKERTCILAKIAYEHIMINNSDALKNLENLKIYIAKYSKVFYSIYRRIDHYYLLFFKIK